MMPLMTFRPERPLVGAAIAVIAGSAIGLTDGINDLCTAHHLLVFGMVILLSGICWQLRSVSRGSVMEWGRMFSLWVGAGLLAVANAMLQEANLDKSSRWTPPTGVIEVEALVTAEPDCYRLASGQTLQKTTGIVTGLPGCTLGIPSNAALRIVWFGDANRLSPQYGDRWHFNGRLKTNDKARRPPYVELVVDRGDSRRLATGQGQPWMSAAINARQICRILLTNGIESFDRETAVLNSLMLGYSDDVSKETRSWFVKTGTIHIFAISGSHVIIVAGVIIFLLRRLRVSRTRWFSVLVPLLVFYTFVTGLQISAIRAVTMATLYWLAPCVGRRSDIFSALSLAAIAILAVAPHQVQSPGFILSFAVTLALAMGYPPIMRWLEQWLKPDPLMAEPERSYIRFARTSARFVLGLIVASTVAELAAAPIVAYYFNLVVPVGIVANLIMAPLAFLSIVTGILSLAAGLVLPWLGVAFNHVNVAFADLMLDCMAFLSAVPRGNMEVHSPPLWAIIIYYGLYLTVLTFLYRRSKSAYSSSYGPDT